MNQIQLFNSQQHKQINEDRKSSSKKSARSANRPKNINVSKIFSNNQKWRECKIIGKNISIRSYSACCAFQGKFYVYGGYQILNGSLNQFFSIDLNDSEPKFNWVSIEPKGQKVPGPRSKHALLAGKNKIYLIGGLYADAHSSNDIFQFCPETEEWKQLHPEGIQNIPKLDSFGCILIEKEGEETIYIIGGYNDDKAEMQNAVYEFVPSKNTVSVVFQNQPASENVMPARCGLAVATDYKNIFIFGGKSENARNNDLWKFNLKSFKYERLPDNGTVPAVRNGHTMNFFNDRLYVFGGIHDITWELDDLHIYHLLKKEWTTLEQDSPRNIVKKVEITENKGDINAQKKVNKKKSWYETMGSGLNGKSCSSPMNNTNRRNFTTAYSKEEDGNKSPGKMIDQQRKKVFQQKKTEMLKNFQVNDNEKQKFLRLQTSSQAMKNSLDVIGNPDGKAYNNSERLTEFGKESHSKFLCPLENNSNLVVGKKPCARDGHCSVMLNDELIIFGGDRHQMSFNDIYKLNFTLAQKEIEK